MCVHMYVLLCGAALSVNGNVHSLNSDKSGLYHLVSGHLRVQISQQSLMSLICVSQAEYLKGQYHLFLVSL